MDLLLIGYVSKYFCLYLQIIYHFNWCRIFPYQLLHGQAKKDLAEN